MPFTAEQLRVASKIDKKVGKLLNRRCGDLVIMGEMADEMPAFQKYC
jgi:hypothetical protein